MDQENILAGSLLSLLAFLAVAIMGALAKYANHFFPIFEVVFFQNFLSFVFFLPLFFKERKVWQTQRLGLHFFRAVVGASAWCCLFFAFQHTTMTEATLLTYSAPLWLPLVGFWLFKEKIPLRVWPGVFLGFVGIIFVLHPSSFFQSWTLRGSGVALFASILLTAALFGVRLLRSTEGISTMVFYYFGISSVIFFVLALSDWHMPHVLRDWFPLFGIGFFSVLAQVFIIYAYRHGSPAKLSSSVYSVIVFTAIIDHFVWHSAFNYEIWIGMFLVIAGGIVSSVPIRWSHSKTLHKGE